MSVYEVIIIDGPLKPAIQAAARSKDRSVAFQTDEGTVHADLAACEELGGNAGVVLHANGDRAQRPFVAFRGQIDSSC